MLLFSAPHHPKVHKIGTKVRGNNNNIIIIIPHPFRLVLQQRARIPSGRLPPWVRRRRTGRKKHPWTLLHGTRVRKSTVFFSSFFFWPNQTRCTILYTILRTQHLYD